MRKHTHRLLNLGVVIAMVLMAVSPTTAWAAPSYTSQPQAATSTVREPTIAIQLSAEDYRVAPALSPNYVVDYGSFVWLEIPAKQLARLEASGLAYQHGETTIGSYNFKFDPLEGIPLVPANLQMEASATEPSLYLIQFIGPITDHWLADASKSGIKLLQYYAHNAYLAWGTGAQLERLDGKNYVRWSGVFQPAYKFNPNLNSLKGRIENVAITFYNDGNIERTLDVFTGMGGEVIQAFPAQPDKAFYTAIVALEADRLAEAARLSTVWAMDYSSPRPGFDDENATQIVAGNYTSSTSIPTGFYNWLATKGVNGSGVTWADVDTGLNATHPDLTGRAIAFVSYPGAGAANVDTDGHGSHTAGAIMGDGRGGTGIQDPNGFYWGTGMAPSSTLVVQNALEGTNWPPTGGWQLLSKDSVTNGASGSSNSWYTGSYSNDYTAACRTHDLMVRDANFDTTTVAEPIIYIFSAGNGGPNYSTLSEPHAAKNPVTVGAATNYPRSGVDINGLAYFSSRGPATDGRLLPSVTAPGYQTASLNGSSANCGSTVAGAGSAYYNYCSGTSMAAPLVAGSSALIVDWWKQENAGAVPSPAMVKALLINSGDDMVGGNRAVGGTAGVIGNLPNNDQGWGRVNLNKIIRTGVPTLYYDQETILGATGETWQKTLTAADPTKPVKVSLVWTDAAGAAGANPALVNNLNLTVVNGSNTYRGNNFASGWSTSSTTVDNLNNLENVYLPAGTTGALQVTIEAANIAGDGIPYNADITDQDFALVIYNARADGGTIAGTVTEASVVDAAGDPIVGAKVTAAKSVADTFTALSGAGGVYAMFVPTGTYNLEVEAYGYLPVQRSGVEVTLNSTTTQNFSATVAADYVISGTVTDSATGYPLPATITVDGEPFDPPVASVQTDPATGYYSLTVADGQTYTLTAAALLHTSQVRNIGTPTGNQTQNFALVATTTNGGIAGWVRNYYTNDPIANATVTVATTGSPSDQTDANGYFEILNLAPNSYTATATANLYSPVSLSNIEVLTSNVAIRTFLLPTSHMTYSPATLEQTITFGSSITDNAGLVITNTGLGDLTFGLIEQGALAWLSESPVTGTLPGGVTTTQNIQMVWDASNASAVPQPGIYTGTLQISNNDPLMQGNTSLPVTMNVQPSATQGKLAGTITSLGYCNTNTAPLAGASVIIQNAGGFTQTLLTNTAGQYEWWLDSAGNTYTVTVSHPAHLGNSTTVAVTAGATTTHDVALYWLQPCVNATPDNLSVTIAQGLSTTVPMTLSNNGAAALNFKLVEKEGGFLPVEAGEDVLVVRYDSAAADAMQAALTANGYTYLGVTSAQFQALTVTELLDYSAVFHAGITGLSGSPGASENLLVAYLNAGGHLFIADNDLGYYRNASTFYTAYLQSTYNVDNGGEIATGEDIMAGLTLDVTSDPYPDGFTVAAEGTRIFQSNNSYAFGVKVERAGYQAIYLSFDFDEISTTAGETELVARVMDYLGQSDVTWLSTVPVTGTIASTANQVVDVTFDAGVPEITQPGIYTATLLVKSNDPINDQYNIPVTMNVNPLATSGKLEGVITTTGYCDNNPVPLAGATVFIEGSGGYTQTLVTGSDGVYQWWLDAAQSPYTVTVSANNHPTTVAVVAISAGMTTTQNFVLRLQQPCLAANPTSFNVNVELGANTTQPLTLTNSGAIALIYALLENQPWLSTVPVTGTTAPDGGTSAIAVTFDAGVPEITQPGTYTTTLTVQSNDPINGNYALPISMVVSPPSAYGVLAGTITGLQRCDAPGGPLANAQVLVQSAGGLSWTVTSNATGLYDLWLNQGAYTVTVSASGYATSAPAAVNVSAQVTTTQNVALRLDAPCINAAPLSLEATVTLGNNQVTTLTVTNQGAASSLLGLEEVPGTPVVVEALPQEAPATAAATTGPKLATAETGIASGSPVIGTPSSLVAPEDIGTAWETMAPLPSARVFNAVIAAGNYVYVIGGTSDPEANVPTNTNYRYNTATNTWDTMATVPVTLDSIDGIAINGKIYIPGDALTATTYVYDIAGNSWSTIAASGGYTARSQYQVVAIGTQLYVLGGIIASSSASTTEVWVLDTTTGTWTAGVPMQKSRTSFSAAAINGQIYVAGGVLFPGFTPDMTSEKFNGTAWSYIANVPNGGGAYTRWSYNADATGPQGLWLAAGRRDLDWNVLDHAGYYDPTSDTWTDSPTIPILVQERVYMEGDVAADGYFYVIGGRNGAGDVAYDTNERLLVGTSTPVGADTVPWLAEVPLTGTVSADSNFPVQITFTALPTMTTGIYTATLRVNSQDSANSSIAIPVTLTIVAPPVCGFTSSSPDDVGQTTIFTNTSTGSEPLTYRWNFGDGSPLSAATSPTHTYPQVGLYTVVMTATNAYGESVCSNPVSIEGVPLASFISNSPVTPGQLAVFTNTTVANPAVSSWLWDFGDPVSGGNNFSTLMNPTHLYATAGTYTVTLTAANLRGTNVYVSTVNVFVPGWKLYLPLILR